MSTPSNPVQANQVQLFAADKAAQAALRNAAITQILNINSQTIYPTSQNVLNITPRNVGIIKRFWVEITGTITNTHATDTATLTDIGLANILSNVTFYDLNNNLRINTSGVHLSLLSALKRRRPLGGTAQYNTADGNNVSTMFNVGPATWGVFQAPATIAANGGTGNYRAVFEVPLEYDNSDMRGAVFANVVNSTMNLQLTLNQNPISAAGSDETFAVYSGATGTHTNSTITVYQEHYDQFNVANLPTIALSTVYELKASTFKGMTPAQDFPMAFANFRDFLSVCSIYNNSGSSGGRANGSDINTWALTTANYTNIFKYGPLTSALLTQNHLSDGLPAGTYYFDFRQKPIWTTQYGNTELVVNPSTAGANAYAYTMWEALALQNTLVGGASLAAG